MRLSNQTSICILILAMVLHVGVNAQASSLEFDVSEFRASPFEFKGYLQLQTDYLSTDPASVAHQLRFDPEDQYKSILQTTGTLELEAHYSQGMSGVHLRTHSSRLWDDISDADDEHDIYESYLSFDPKPAFSLEMGKKLARWGKGYAWNPVGFVERKKDPSDPELSREGYWMQTLDLIRSTQGHLETVGFTSVILPNNGHLNEDYGQPDHNNIALKLYLLYRDIDIDILYLNNASKTARYGLDFAYNIAPHFEIHGEYAWISDASRTPLTTGCSSGEKITENVSSYLLGMRYRTQRDITLVAEYYHNGEGFTEDEMRQYYDCVHQAWAADDDVLLGQLAAGGSLNRGAFTTQNPMRNYLHLKSWWNEPGDILYFIPGLQVLYNLDDTSYLVTPELLYKGIDNLQLRLRYKLFSGDPLTEYGEKLSDRKLELRARYYF